MPMSFITAKSFVFNGINSSDYNVVIGWVDSDITVSENGLNREVRKTTNQTRTTANIYGAENIDVISFEFDIVRIDGKEITRTQSIMINQWLTASPLPQLLKFNDSDGYVLHYYAVCTQIEDIVIGGRLVGKKLKFETNSPFAFAEKNIKNFNINGTLSFHVNNFADTYNGIFYPTIAILTQADSIIIENITDKKSVTINTSKLIAGSDGYKYIKLDSNNMAVLDRNNKLIPISQLGWNENYKSYVSSINGYIDNIYWFRLVKGMNEIKVVGSCKFTMEYEFPRKAGCL